MQTTGKEQYEIFRHGAAWLRADFHLHTRADQEFCYSGDENYFVTNYVDGLREAEIQIGVIANHNKFDAKEFKDLCRLAKKKGGLLLPGVELSIRDGKNAIHTIIVFSDAWLQNGDDHINPFLTIAFEGKTPSQYEHENGQTSLGLIETIKKLEGYHRDFFLVFAHVEQTSGLWEALEGGRLTELGKDELFRRRTLGFQKVRTHDKPDKKCRTKVKQWLENWYPAEVEGSDCKSIVDIGKGEKCFLKIGDFTFESVKYALQDHSNRVAKQPVSYTHSHIRGITFEGGALAGQEIAFSPELNCLIGIRGSGKSSILECLRYALDIPFGDKTLDQKYKQELLRHVLGSGGKVVVKAVDRYGQPFEIHRILNQSPDVFVNGQRQPGISIRETIIHRPIYFGQKDLSSSGEGFERDLVEKLLGERLLDVRQRIEAQKERVVSVVKRLDQLAKGEEQIKEYRDKKEDAEFRLKIFRDFGIEEKLQQQVGFETDGRKIVEVIALVEQCLAALAEFLQTYEDDVNNIRRYKSEENAEFFTDFFSTYERFLKAFATIKYGGQEGIVSLTALREKSLTFAQFEQEQKDRFAETQRQIAAELKIQGKPSIQMDDFLKLRRVAEQANQMLEALAKQQTTLIAVEKELWIEFGTLNDLWHEEFKQVQIELEKVNSHHTSLTLEAEFKSDKAAMLALMKELFKGSKIREGTLNTLISDYADFGEMWRQWPEARAKTGSTPEVFEAYFRRNMATLLTWQPPNSFTIKYRGKELKQHSLGQRASALILFILSQQDTDLVIIDQPEDDLDNQTIYADVIKLICEMKSRMQFIFATHNANFPVLGDAEQVLACRYANDQISIQAGGVDNAVIQQEIVNIMEGGEEAFQRRKEIYRIWKPRN